ncbi:flagellar biosynthetic protein FliR [bacterium]|nr:flagellar biosynthetic protein FliR [bacterium]
MLFDIQNIEGFIFMLVRISAALMAMPIFGQQGIPRMLKVSLALAITLLLFPVVPHASPAGEGALFGFLVLILKETVCGLVIGYAINYVFYAVEFAGAIIGYQAGFAIVSSIDPMTNSRNPVLGRVQYILVVLLFFLLNGHHLFLSGLAQSFETIPLGMVQIHQPFLTWTLSIITGITATAVMVVAPIMVALILTDVGLGILARVAPQMNIFVVGFSLKVGIVLLLMSSGMGAFAWLFTKHFSEFRHQFFILLKLLGPV